MTRKPPSEDEYDAAIEAVAGRKFDVWSKLLVGAYARVAIAEKERDEAQHQLAKMIQRIDDLKRMYALPTGERN